MNKYLAVILAIAALVVLVYIFNPTILGLFLGSEGKYDDFAKCLGAKAVMYGSETCPHCKNQKALFGNSFKYINYVECGANPQACTNAGVQSIPMWVIGNTTLIGEQALTKLSAESGCPLA